jgi:hypothetical protein
MQVTDRIGRNDFVFVCCALGMQAMHQLDQDSNTAMPKL